MPIIISGKGYISKALAEVIAQAKADGIEIIYQDSPEPTTPTTMKNILAAATALIFGSQNAFNLTAPILPPTYSHSKGRIRSNQRQTRKARRQAFANGNRRAFH